MRSIKAKQTEVFYSSLLPPKKTFQRLRTYPTHAIHTYISIYIYLLYTHICSYIYVCVYINTMAPPDFQSFSWVRKHQMGFMISKLKKI